MNVQNESKISSFLFNISYANLYANVLQFWFHLSKYNSVND